MIFPRGTVSGVKPPEVVNFLPTTEWPTTCPEPQKVPVSGLEVLFIQPDWNFILMSSIMAGDDR